MKHSLCIAYNPARDDMEDDNFGIKRLPNGQFQLAVYFSDRERL